MMVHAAVALAIARALCTCSFPILFDVRLVGDVDDDEFARAIAPAIALAGVDKSRAANVPVTLPRAVPLAELCHALAACLP